MALKRTRKTLTAARRVRNPVDGSSMLPIADRLIRAPSNTRTRAITTLTSGTGDRDHDLLGGVLRHARQPREAADRQERDVRRGDAVTAGGDGVTELVEDDAGEDRDDEQDAVECRRRPALRVLGDADPGEQEQEGHVDADFAARNLTNGE